MRGVYLFIVPAGLATFCALAERPPFPLARDTMVNLVDGDLLPAAAWFLLTTMFMVPWLFVVAAGSAAAPAPKHGKRPDEFDIDEPSSVGPLPAVLVALGLGFGAYGGWGYSDAMTGNSTEPFVAFGVGGAFLLFGLVGWVVG
ncbi:MAG: hypothetical protein KC912_17660 [Proteobacteria bacterium]|nr:hypothetical protein [Pseudomonadota bacterium]